MDFDYTSLIGGGALVALLFSVVIWIVSLLVFYLIVRAAVTHGLRSHQLWMEKHRPEHSGQHAQSVAAPEQ